jgi:alkylhydroperoxidase family enzyme
MANLSSVNPDSVPEHLRPALGIQYNAILAHRPELLEAWSALDDAFLGPSSTVPNEIKEEARRTLAQDAGCVFCASLGKPARYASDPQEALAVALAAQIANDHRQIDAATFEALREEFSEEQIVELVSWICWKLGSNILGALMALEPADESQVNAYADLVAGG